MPDAKCASIAVIAMLVAASARADDPPPQPAAPSPPTASTPPEQNPSESLLIHVTATTPLHGSHLPKDHVAANVQTFSAEDLADHKSLDLSAYAREALGSVHINDVQGNPLQSDVQYRGFLVSPLLGASKACRCTSMASGSTSHSATRSTGISFPRTRSGRST